MGQILRVGERPRLVQVQRYDFCTGGCCIEGQQLPYKMGGLIWQIHCGASLSSVGLSFRCSRIKRLAPWLTDPLASTWLFLTTPPASRIPHPYHTIMKVVFSGEVW